MGRYTGPVCRLCRREGVKLFLKGDRCRSSKCSVEKRDKPPGMHDWRRGKPTEYGIRMREKQKVKRHYGIFERQFKNYFKLAEKLPGNTGETLLVLMERRLDNVVMKTGFAVSHAQARQYVHHGHIFVNGKKVNIPSYLIKEGDVITPAPNEVSQKIIKAIRDNANRNVQLPSWMEASKDNNLQVKVVHLPVRSEVMLPIQEQLIVEFCSR